MKMNKKILIASIISIFVILAIIMVFIFIPQQTTTAPSFTCPDDKLCQITPILTCNVQSDQGKVIARTNAKSFLSSDLNGLGVWIALDSNNDGTMEGYSFSSTTSSCISLGVTYPIDGNNDIYVRNGRVYLCDSRKSYEFKPTSVAITNQEPTEPYTSNNQEVYLGKLYECQRDILINNKLVDTLIYSGSSSGKKTGKTYQLTGETITSEGVGFIEWDYKIENIPITECLVDGTTLYTGESICIDDNTLVTCTAPPQTTPDYRDPYETNARCVGDKFVDAYNVKLELKSQSTITLGEKFIINFDLDDEIYSENSVEIRATLNNDEDTYSALTDSRGQLTIELEPQTTGTKEIIVTMQHPEKDYTSEIINGYVTEPLQITTFKTQSPQFDNDLIEIVIEVTKGGSFKDWKPTTTYPLEEATYNNNKVNFKERTKTSTGLYNYYYDLSGDGLLRFRIKASDETGLVTDFTTWQEVEVKKAQILLKNIDVPFSVCNNANYKTTFELVDSTGKPVNGATVTAIIYEGVKEIRKNVDFNGDGHYSFDHYYTESVYTDLIASKDGLTGSQLNIPSSILSCGVNDDDDGNNLIYSVISALILGVGGFIYFVFVRKNGKK